MILQTRRLTLREFNVSDARNMFLLNADPEVLRYTGDVSFTDSADAGNFLQKYSDYKRNGYGRWAVIETDSNEFLGWCGLKLHENGETDIGFRLMKKYWNRGFATEAAKACLDYGFGKLKLESIIGRAMKDNLASIRVLEKIGLVYETDFDFIEHPGAIYRITKNS